MTEADWLTSTDPAAMIRLYTSDDMPWPMGTPAPLVSERKLRLFACACCRQVWEQLTDPRSRCAVKTAENYADGLAEESELNRVHDESRLAWAHESPLAWVQSHNAAGLARYSCLGNIVHGVLSIVRRELVGVPSQEWLAATLRDLVGNPYRPVELPKEHPLLPVGPWECDGFTITHGWGDYYCPWLTPTVVSLAAAAYDDRMPDGTLDPVRLMVLADALTDAGCDSAELLAHLRGLRRCTACAREGGKNAAVCECAKSGGWFPMVKPPAVGPHYRGCWAVDLILGKG